MEAYTYILLFNVLTLDCVHRVFPVLGMCVLDQELCLLKEM